MTHFKYQIWPSRIKQSSGAPCQSIEEFDEYLTTTLEITSRKILIILARQESINPRDQYKLAVLPRHTTIG